MTTITTFDPKDLETKVKSMYRSVAENPHGEFHFEMGRALAERLGYAPADLDRIPAEAIESFAGVGHYRRRAHRSKPAVGHLLNPRCTALPRLRSESVFLCVLRAQ